MIYHTEIREFRTRVEGKTGTQKLKGKSTTGRYKNLKSSITEPTRRTWLDKEPMRLAAPVKPSTLERSLPGLEREMNGLVIENAAQM